MLHHNETGKGHVCDKKSILCSMCKCMLTLVGPTPLFRQAKIDLRSYIMVEYGNGSIETSSLHPSLTIYQRISAPIQAGVLFGCSV